ncbi:MAG: hypothetical protein EPN17_00815 [Methylobacter sp.]|nr:MAG: hypothetical protein EPN17_00815 [Methylobacter sp.]
MLNINWSHSKRIIASGHYKGTPLTTRQIKSKKGKPTALVLWDTKTNQPAQPGDDADDQIKTTPCDNLVTTISATSNSGPASLSAQSGQRIDLNLANAQANTGNHIDGADVKPSAPAENPSLLLQKKTTTVLPFKNMAIEPEQPELTAETLPLDTATLTEDQTSQEPPDFETLLHRKVCDKKKSTQRSLKAYYRKQYAETGEIPASLTVAEGRRFAGKKSTLDQAIQNRFIDMVMKSADPTDIFNYYTKGTRKVTVFHPQLEKEFGRKISIQQLYTVVRSCNLKRFLDMADDEEDSQKLPSFFKAEPVGKIVQMDGVEADYIEILVDGKWRKPIWIEFFDLGSRKLLAMHAYLSESNENSVDIFTRFLMDNVFAHQQMNIRPDNAKGFLNLKRPIKELNNRYAIPNGFTFVDDFARAGTPKDKAHLESSHRAFHSYEGTIVKHFKDQIDSQYKKQKKTGNQLKTVTVTRLNISLDELNNSGITADYMRQHNLNKHRFSEDGVQRSWVPDDRWNAHLAANQTFKFKQEDIELCRRYGYTKAAATISKDGTITYQKRKYSVANQALWSRHSSTKVKVSLIDDHLAIFRDSDEGVYLGDALALVAPVKSEKLLAKEKAKVVKIHTDNEFFTIVAELKRVGMIVNEDRLKQMLADGLTYEAISQLLVDKYERYSQKPGTIVPFNLFASDVKEWLGENKGKKLIPYADVKA